MLPWLNLKVSVRVNFCNSFQECCLHPHQFRARSVHVPANCSVGLSGFVGCSVGISGFVGCSVGISVAVGCSVEVAGCSNWNPLPCALCCAWRASRRAFAVK